MIRIILILFALFALSLPVNAQSIVYCTNSGSQTLCSDSFGHFTTIIHPSNQYRSQQPFNNFLPSQSFTPGLMPVQPIRPLGSPLRIAPAPRYDIYGNPRH